jgi:hypothetical protein
MGYIHIEIDSRQRSKKAGKACGDAFCYYRTPEATLIILADGIGSGIKANIYANMAVARLEKLLRQGVSLRKAFATLVETMHEARGTELPYAVFTLVQILKNGETTILAYEMPEGILISRRLAAPCKTRNFTLGNEVISETNLFLEAGESLIIYTDGISQAGIGGKTRLGWSSKEIAQFTNNFLQNGSKTTQAGREIFAQAIDLWGKRLGDDCTLISAYCRPGKVVNLLSGPALDKRHDHRVVKDFCATEGEKIVCGATTARIVARETGRNLSINQADRSLVAPPGYSIAGIDLVSEGAVSLNQAFNILDEDPLNYEPDSSVSRLCAMLCAADRVNFYLGNTTNEGHADISFKQKGIIPRAKIIKMLAQRLQNLGKLVAVHNI